MQKAVPVGVGAMAALLGLEFDVASAVAREAAQGQVCEAANDNGAGQVVVSGDKAAVERAVEIAKAKGAKRAMLLPVSAPFHCALMQPAADVMAEALAKVSVKRPLCRWSRMCWPSRSANRPRSSARLVAQVTGTVRWRELVAFMAQAGVQTFYEVGAGKVLSGLIKRIADGANAQRDWHRRTILRTFNAGRKHVMFDLTDKTALVTGATGGIGAAIARALHGQGATVAISGTRREVLEALAARAERSRACVAVRSGRQSRSRGSGAGRRREDAEARYPGRQCRGHQRQSVCAIEGRRLGSGDRGQSDRDLPPDPRRGDAHDAPPLRAAIIGITSVVGVTGNPGQGNYTASKAGMIGMMKSVAAEYAKRNVTANCIAPGIHRYAR